jgi:tartrate dehydratase alpha subunit/fumarate hydratase class I-like protein
MVFNKQLTKEEFEKVRDKIREHLPYYLHPKNLTKEHIEWLEKNIKQFDKEVLNRIIKNSELPEKPKEVDS